MGIWVVSRVELQWTVSINIPGHDFWCTVECWVPRVALRDFWDARVTAPGSIPGAALITLFEAEAALGFKHAFPQLCSCSLGSPPPLPPRLSVPPWALPSDSSDPSHWTACGLWWHSLGPLLLSPRPSCLSCPRSPPLTKVPPCHQRSPTKFFSMWRVGRTCPFNYGSCHRHTGGCRAERLGARALKSGFLVQILVASYQLCNSSHIFSRPQLIVLGQSENSSTIMLLINVFLTCFLSFLALACLLVVAC